MSELEKPGIYDARKQILFFQFLTIAAIIVSPFFDSLEDFGFEPLTWWKLIGTSFCVVGLGLVTWSIYHMREAFTIQVRPKGVLVVDGPFSLCRNPIYFGVLLVAFGWSVFWLSLLSLFLAVFLVVVLNLKIMLEEKELKQMFGKSFEKYCAHVPRLIPRP